MEKERNFLRSWVFYFLVIPIILSCPWAYAAKVTLAWDPNSEPDVAGYRVYIGSDTGIYPHNEDAGKETSYTLANLVPGKTYYFYVTAYNSLGLESSPSEEVVYEVPADAAGMDHKLIAGFGGFAEDGGWAEVVGPDYLHDGWLRVDWPDYNTVSGETRIARGDIDGDGKDEIIIGLGPVSGNSSIPAGMFEVLDHDYTHLAWGQVEWSDYNALNGETWPAAGDVDGDRKDEIIIGLGQGGGGQFATHVYQGGQPVHWTWSEVNWTDYNQAVGETRPACGDIDSDKRDEILIGLGKGGNAIMQVFEDSVQGHTFLTSLKVGPGGYDLVNGETWPAVVMLNRPLWINPMPWLRILLLEN